MSSSSKEKKAKGGKSKMLLIGLPVVILLAAGGAAGGYYFASGSATHAAEPEKDYPKLVERSDDEAPPAEGGKGGEGAAPREGTVSVDNDRFKPDPRKYSVVYVPIKENFTANLANGGGFIQISINLATYYDDTVVHNIERQQVPIRSAVLMILAEQDISELQTSAGKAQLQKKLTEGINEVLRSKEGFGGIDNVYFSNFVVQ